MSGEELLHKATGGWRFKTNNKMRGAFAETDFSKKTVRLNKKIHKKGGSHDSEKKNPDGSASMLNSIEHELQHIRDPKATEKQVRKRTRKSIKRLSPKQKKKRYALFRR